MKITEHQTLLVEADILIERALDILLGDASYSDALEYCADQIALTRAIGKVAAELDMSLNGLTIEEAHEKYHTYGIVSDDLCPVSSE